MKIIISLLLITFSFTGTVQSQDYDSMLGHVENSEMYFRFDHEPVTLCQLTTVSDEWSLAIGNAIQQINQFIGMVMGTENCDILLSITATLPIHCKHTWGCTDIGYRQSGDHLIMISQVSILSSRSERMFLLLHELLHALGIIGHSDDRNDIMYPVVNSSIKILSASNGALLEYLYSRLAFR